MPNHVHNNLTINGASILLEKFFIDNKKKENIDTEELEELLCFSNLVPIINQDNWYEECIQKWSTKWEPYDIEVKENYSNNILEYEFNTAWSPPHEWLLSVSKIYPELEFTIYSEDEFINFFCENIYIDGKHTNLYEYDCNQIKDYMKDYLKLNPYNIYNYLLSCNYNIQKLSFFLDKKNKVEDNEINENEINENEINENEIDSELYDILSDYNSENNLFRNNFVQNKILEYLIDWIRNNIDNIKNLQSCIRSIFAKRILFRYKISKELAIIPPLCNGYPGGEEYHEGLARFNELYKNKFI
jgi:hypothetical protein